jgi:uncharacterized protein (TIGR03083 family)
VTSVRAGGEDRNTGVGGGTGGDGTGGDSRWLERGLVARDALAETWGSLADACHELSSAEWALPTECPGWDVKDQLSHLIGIERTITGDSPPTWDGPLGPHVKNDFAASNEPWIAVRRSRSGPEVYAEFVDVTTRRLDQMGELTEEGWAAVGWSPIGQQPHAVFMEVRVFDSWVHEQDARRALDRPGGSGGRASAMALDRVQGAMGFVVAKQAACPDGTAVRFDLTGLGRDARSFTVAVAGGRGSLLEHAEQNRSAPGVGRGSENAGTATVRIALSAIDFVRLGCGRATVEQLEAAGGIGLEGDAVVGMRVLDNMNFLF